MANKFIEYTIKGMNSKYYLRHMLLISPLPLALFILPFSAPTVQVDLVIMNMVVFGVFWLLYPFARFAYEAVFEYILGNNTFFVSALFAILSKIVTMVLCYLFSIVIAPIGLVILYFINNKQVKLAEAQAQQEAYEQQVAQEQAMAQAQAQADMQAQAFIKAMQEQQQQQQQQNQLNNQTPNN